MSEGKTAPAGIPVLVWLVIKPSGERHWIDKEPLEGISTWVKGLNVQVIEYRFAEVRYRPPVKK